MTYRVSLISVIGLMAMMVLPYAVAGESGGSPVISTTGETISKVSQNSLKNEAADPAPPNLPVSGLSSPIGREAPAISGRYSIGGTTVMPFLGAGFSGGYLSDVDRSVSSALSSQTESTVRSLFGQSLVPNEFRLGIRIPF